MKWNRACAWLAKTSIGEAVVDASEAAACLDAVCAMFPGATREDVAGRVREVLADMCRRGEELQRQLAIEVGNRAFVQLVAQVTPEERIRLIAESRQPKESF